LTLSRGQRDDPKIKQQVALLAEVFKTAFMELGFDAIVKLFPGTDAMKMDSY
jgi:hypothetical protein